MFSGKVLPKGRTFRFGRKKVSDLLRDKTLLLLKPQVPNIPNEHWLLMAEHGITDALLRCFWHWVRELHCSGARPPASTQRELMASLFGEAWVSAFELHQGTFGVFYRIFTSDHWQVGELGDFGEWLHLAGIEEYSRQLRRAILYSFIPNLH